MTTLIARPAEKINSFLAIVRRIIGVPDYDTYLAHHRQAYPDQEPMCRADFDKQRMQDRYSRPGARCC